MTKKTGKIPDKRYRRSYQWMEATDFWILSNVLPFLKERLFIKFENKKIYLSLCSDCKRDMIINVSRSVRYCPACSQKREADKQRIKRAIKQGLRLCKYCRKPLPKKYPNRVFCKGGTCKQAAYRERKREGEEKRFLQEIPFSDRIKKWANGGDNRDLWTRQPRCRNQEAR
jgi:hypothetical protein